MPEDNFGVCSSNPYVSPNNYLLLHVLQKVNASDLSEISGKIATSEMKAGEAYDKLLSHYPNNVRGLRDFARFVDEILSDSKTAHKIWAKADKLEERETAIATTSYRGLTKGPTPGAPDPTVEPPEFQNPNYNSDNQQDNYIHCCSYLTLFYFLMEVPSGGHSEQSFKSFDDYSDVDHQSISR